MTLTLAFSPCPNDTFIFDALVNGKIDTGDLKFDVVMEDVQTLNDWAKQGKYHISKVSYGTVPIILDKYIILNSGGALGQGVGPLLIAKSIIEEDKVNDLLVAIPGENTTAHLLFNLAFPGAKNKQFMVFHEIEEAVLNNTVDAGVIIHENRFTYQQKGLHRIIDLGEYWEETTGVPIPLGGIVAQRSLPGDVITKVDQLIRNSLAHAFANYPLVTEYVKQHSQEMEEQVMRQHIDLYVNDFSLDLGEQGKKAVQKLVDIYLDNHPRISLAGQPLFAMRVL